MRYHDFTSTFKRDPSGRQKAMDEVDDLLHKSGEGETCVQRSLLGTCLLMKMVCDEGQYTFAEHLSNCAAAATPLLD